MTSGLLQLYKVLKKAMKNKLEKLGSKLLNTGKYQTWFKKGISTATNFAQVLNDILKKERKDLKETF